MANEKKTLYHSELVQMGHVQVTQKNLPQKSRYAGKPDYVALVIDGVERLYNCENETCAAFFNVQGNQGRTMVIEALGTRDDAIIDWIRDVAPEATQAAAPQARQAPARAATPPPPARTAAPAQPHSHYSPAPVATAPTARTAPPAAPTAPPPAQTAPPAPRQPTAPPKRQGPSKEEQDAKLKHVRLLAAKLSNVCQISRTAAEHAAAMFDAQRGAKVAEDQIQSWAASIFIQIVRDGHHLDMPAGVIPIGTPPATIPGEPDPGAQGVEAEDDVPMNY